MNADDADWSADASAESALLFSVAEMTRQAVDSTCSKSVPAAPS
jgi:hypothetical protein